MKEETKHIYLKPQDIYTFTRILPIAENMGIYSKQKIKNEQQQT